MICTCPACGRTMAAGERDRDVACACGHRFDPSARPTVADPFVGKDVNGYRVEALLGQGGMGAVYRAVQESLGRPVALKVLPAQVADTPQFVSRFHREAQILASLSHPNVVQVFDRGEFEGRYYFVMEFVDGETVRDLLRRGPVPPKEACRIVTSLLSALDYAHERGVLHRDVKPENVLLTRDGAVKVADFGLGRVLGETVTDTRLTHTHLLLGTFEYMAPEQRERTKDADARADIYATAVVFYEMLTGELPIGRFELPGARLPGLGARLDAVLDKGLAKDPDRRFDRASAMGRAVASLLTTPDAPVDMDALHDRRAEVPLDPPTRYAVRYDVLLTVLGISGIVIGVLGALMLFGGSAVGLLVGAHGALLWKAADRARRYSAGAIRALLVLTLLATPSILGIVLAIWTWRTLLDGKMRAYLDARRRGRDEAESAAVAQGVVPATPPPAAQDRLRAAGRTNGNAAILCGAIGIAMGITYLILQADKGFRDETPFFFAVSGVANLICFGFYHLYRQVPRGRHLVGNARVWMLLAWANPKAAARARMLLRDAAEGPLGR